MLTERETVTTLSLKPIYLFADSQLLFWRENGFLFLDLVRARIDVKFPRAAYIGASNGDKPEFYALFKEAMESIMIRDCRMISSSYAADDAAFLNNADLILLAGGDVKKGWQILERSGMKEDIIRRYTEGALLIGISAGAVQLGMLGRSEDDIFETLKLVPFIIGTHEEKTAWEELQETIERSSWNVQGTGIPAGGGAVYHQDNSIEAIRQPLSTFFKRDGKAIHSLLMPPKSSHEELASSEIN
jgi:peptidase E